MHRKQCLSNPASPHPAVTDLHHREKDGYCGWERDLIEALLDARFCPAAAQTWRN
jgi:hypothetical protein